MTVHSDRRLPVLNLSGDLPLGRFAIEASAGTGKTFSLTALVARHVAEFGLRPDQLLMVTFTRAAAADMSHRTRLQIRELASAFRTALSNPNTPDVDSLAPWISASISEDAETNVQRLNRLETFLATYDETTITTIHGFLHLVLNRVGLQSPVDPDAVLLADVSDIIRQVTADQLIGVLANDPEVFADPDADDAPKLIGLLDKLVKMVQTLFNNLDSKIEPECTATDHSTAISQLPLEKRWAVIVERILRSVRQQLDQQDLIGFDRIVTAVRDLVESDAGSTLVAALRDQYHVVLVDEFQDTDQVQWQILTRLFGDSDDDGSRGDQSEVPRAFGTVGDPKQSIYRFRGADIEAYQIAVGDVAQTLALTTNYRSNKALLDAVNHLFEGVHFGSQDIVYREVGPRSGSDGEGVVGSPSLEIRWLPFSEQLGAKRKANAVKAAEKRGEDVNTVDDWNMNTVQAREVIFADLAYEIAALLRNGRLIDKTGSERSIKPGDIAVLVTAHEHADRLFTVLSLAGIPGVRYRTQSVFTSRAVFEWQVLLEALSQPTNSGYVRACMVSAFGEYAVHELASWDDAVAAEKVGEWQRNCANWAELLQRSGVAALYLHLRSQQQLESHVANRTDGERLLTDLDHIAEILSRRPGLVIGSTPADFRRELSMMCQEPDDEGEYQRRVDSDADAVHLATVHHSKGLEFPVVFLPAMATAPSSKGLQVYNRNGQRYLDVAPSIPWVSADGFDTADDRKDRTALAELGDAMRKLYVAATRAEHKLVVYWAVMNNQSAAKSPLGRVLFGRDENGKISIDPNDQAPIPRDIRSNQQMEAELLKLAAPIPGIAIIAVDPATKNPVDIWKPQQDHDVLEVARFNRVEPVRQTAWRKWSYSRLTDSRWHGSVRRDDDPGPGHDENQDSSVPLQTLNRLEGGQEDVTLSGDAVGVPPQVGTSPEIYFPDALAGPAFGSLIHSLFERHDPSSPLFARDILQSLKSQRRSLPPGSADVLAMAMAEAVLTPLGPLFGGRRLADIPSRDRLVEAKFDLQLATQDPIEMKDVARLIAEHLADSDPFRKYADSWARSKVQLNGSLYGEIDAVFRIGEEPTFIVTDYKTNLLHQSGSANALEDYEPSKLDGAMMSNDYVLQALLYSVALHRYLNLRLPNYQPERHLGGVAYFFLRGMVGENTPCTLDGRPYGVATWKPPLALIDALDGLFSARQVEKAS